MCNVYSDPEPGDAPWSVFFRPLRLLLLAGTPPGSITIAFYQFPTGEHLPFGAFTLTRRKRLVFWPALPTRGQFAGTFRDGANAQIDHVTLELTNGRVHVTGYGADREPLHCDRGWRLGDASPSGLRLWLLFSARRSVLDSQCGAFEVSVAMPTTDAERRLAEFRQYGQSVRRVFLPMPATRGDCAVSAIYLLDQAHQPTFAAADFPQGNFWNEWFVGWPDADRFQLAPGLVEVGGVRLIVATTCPPGTLRNGDVFIGGPYREDR